MAWDFRAVEETPADSVGVWVPMGLKIVKALVDDAGVDVVVVDTTIDDALSNAGPGFSAEYYLAVKELFSRQLDQIFTLGDGGNINFALAGIYGRKLEQCLATAKYLSEGAPTANV